MGILIELTVDECLTRLDTQRVGRLALNTHGGLRIFPVNYAVHRDTVVFRTLPYGEIANNGVGAEVAFEIDVVDDARRLGWSVLLVGKLERVEDPGEVEMIRNDLDPSPWAEGARILYFRLAWTDISGREIGPR